MRSRRRCLCELRSTICRVYRCSLPTAQCVSHRLRLACRATGLVQPLRGKSEVPDSVRDVAVSFRKKGEFVTRSIAGEIVVVPVRGQVGDLDAIYNLNDVGAFIWEQFDDWKSVSQVVEAVRAEFEVAFEQADKETTEFIAALEAVGMIESARMV